ncbi:LamG-like jellyroll fold domain-containing protein [Amycolatopsis sp. NPDC059027]|uniref:LamG-like jellyroll fold domain-containing protein n=1 Tax=Amycolatopsis sp. NPDC059027 TaxID=3346709 RepID=UPI00366D6E9C
MTLKFSAGFGAGSGSTIADDSGGGHPLTVASGSYTAGGHTGSGFQNTGGTASTGASGTVGAITGTTCTVMAWVKPSALPTNGVHLICGAMQSNGSTDFALYTQRGDFSTHNVLQGNARLGGGLVAANGSALTVGTWAHVALTFDGSNLKLWLNGSTVATVANAGTLNNNATFYVAGMASAGTGAVTVDDVRYYDSNESANITTLMNTPVGVQSSGCKIFNGTSWIDSGMPQIYSGSAWVTAAKGRVL